MYDASVMLCYAFGDKNGVAMLWNAPKGERDSKILEDPTFGIKDSSVKYENGKLACTFTREKVTNVTVPFGGKPTVVVDLSDSFFLLLAFGTLSGSRSDLGSESDLGFKLDVHDDERATKDKVNLTR